MKKKVLLFLLVFALVASLSSCDFFGGLFGGGSSDEELTVIDNGQTDYALVIAEGASKDEQNLANYIASVSGAELQSDASPETKKEILIGKTNRKATDSIASKLTESASAVVIQFVIAESDGKVVILADDEIGYFYALDYFKTKCISDGKFSLQSGAYDIQSVFWDDYYASDEYYNRLREENENNKPDSGTGGGNNPGSGSGDGLLTVEQMIEQYKNMAASFNTKDFGNYSSKDFVEGNIYAAPTVYPEENSHPRILFTKNTIDDVRANLTDSQNAKAYSRFITLSNSAVDGKFTPLWADDVDNYNSSVSAKIEAKAFRYAMTGEKIYGYEAIYAAKNAMLTIEVKHTVSDFCRRYGHLMYVVACVYDWCYDLLTEEDKAQFVAGGVNLLGMHLEAVCYVSPTNKVPTSQGTMFSHGAEDQILVDYLAFAIAVYDEAPEIYELVAGRILNDFVKAQNYLYQGGSHWAGAMYGSCRTTSTMVSNILFNKMTDGAVLPFKNVDKVIETTTYYIRPDGQFYRLGDVNQNHTPAQGLQTHWMTFNSFYAGNIYNNTYLKNVAYETSNGFNSFLNGVAGLSVVQFLAINDPSVPYTYDGEKPLVHTTSYPYTNVFAKSANDDENAFGLYMAMPELYAGTHSHLECGSFQIYYKGALATDSGAYTTWGNAHHNGYTRQTISSNSLLIYNPNYVKPFESTYNKNMYYSGGQSILHASKVPTSNDEILAHSGLGQCTSLGVANIVENGAYLYSYMAGDMTKAYDAETVDEVCRYMIAVATGNEKCPYTFITYDRITADDASYHKSSLIHVQNEPTVTSDGFAVITNGDGKLVVQSVGFDTEYTVIGGEGKEFWVPGTDDNGNYSLEAGKNIPHDKALVADTMAEYGWGRIEISPKVHEKTNYILTVMYVTDADNGSANVKAKNLCTDTLSGSLIFGKAVFFPKNDKLLSAETSFALDASADTCYITGVKGGTWNIKKDGVTVKTVEVKDAVYDGTHDPDGENIIVFATEGAGTYTITPAN